MKKRIAFLTCLMMFMLTLTLSVGAAGETKTVTILQTSDIHGMLLPYDYVFMKETDTSLAQAATLIMQERERDGSLLLIDGGDLTQENYIQEFRTDTPHPATQALNYLAYDAWVLGNHEFNFEYESLEKASGEFKGVTLLGNAYKDGKRAFPAYEIFDVDGVRVAVVGLTVPYIPDWEKANPEHYNYMDFSSPADELEKILPELEGRVDVTVVAVHNGPENDYYGHDGMRELAEKFTGRIDGLLIGHSHSVIDEEIGGIPVLEPGYHAAYVSKLVIELEEKNGAWVVVRRDGELLDCSSAQPEEGFAAEMASHDARCRALSNKVIRPVGADFLTETEFLPGVPVSVLEDNPIVDLILRAMLAESGADVAAAQVPDGNMNITKGNYTLHDSSALFKYTNILVTASISGKQLKACMEDYAGAFFQQYREGDVTVAFNPEMRLYLYDQFEGVDYEIDISKPTGERICNVMYHGEPLRDDEQLILALSDYRFGNLVVSGILTEDQLLWQGSSIVDTITEYVASGDGPLMPECSGNWKIRGASLDDPQKELIYELVRSGELTIPASEDGRTPNVKVLNGPELRAQGLLPALETVKAPSPDTEEAKSPVGAIAVGAAMLAAVCTVIVSRKRRSR